MCTISPLLYLSQFVSPFTGRIYGRHITGLFDHMQKRVAKLIKRSRSFGLYNVYYLLASLS